MLPSLAAVALPPATATTVELPAATKHSVAPTFFSSSTLPTPLNETRCDVLVTAIVLLTDGIAKLHVPLMLILSCLDPIQSGRKPYVCFARAGRNGVGNIQPQRVDLRGRTMKTCSFRGFLGRGRRFASLVQRALKRPDGLNCSPARHCVVHQHRMQNAPGFGGEVNLHQTPATAFHVPPPWDT